MRSRILRRKCWVLLLLTVVLVWGFVENVQAVDNIDQLNQQLDKQDTPPVQQQNVIWDLAKLVLALGIVVAAAWSVIHLFSRQAKARMQGNWLHVVDEVAMGQNRGIVLCEMRGKFYALGVTDQQINFLFELEDEGLLQEIEQADREWTGSGQAEQPFFSKKLGAFLSPSGPSESSRGFHSRLQEQVRKIKDIRLDRESSSNRKRSGRDE